MAEKEGDGKVSNGQFVSAEDHALQKREDTGPEVYSRISRTRLGNLIQEKRVKSATGVIQAERELFTALSGHQIAKEALANVAVEIKAQKIELENRLREAENRLREAERKAKTADLMDQVTQAELEYRLLEVRKATEELKGEGDNESKYERQLREAAERMDFEAAMKVLQAKRSFQTVEVLLRERDAMKEGVLKGINGEPTAEQRWRLDNIQDFFEKLIDRISP